MPSSIQYNGNLPGFATVRRAVLYSILIESGIHMKLVKLTKMHFSDVYNKVHIGEHLSDTFPIHSGQKEVIFKLALKHVIKVIQENQEAMKPN